MRITSVEIIPSRDDHQARPVLVLGTESGRRGIGEIAGNEQARPATVSATIQALLLGRDSFEVQGLVRDAVAGSDEALLSAAETAMADLSSQELGVPVHQLLGGRVRDDVRACCIDWASGADDVATAVSDARAAVDSGFTALRIGPFDDPDPTRIVDIVHAVRDALPPRIDFAVDATGVGALGDAFELAQQLAPLEPLWLSLPFRDFDVVDLQRAFLRFAVPIAASGDTAQDTLIRLIRQDLIDHVIVDVGAAGGLRAARRIAALAEIYHVGFIPSATSRVSLATALHLAASVPNLTMVEMTPRIGAVRGGMVAIDVTAGLGVDPVAIRQEVA